MANSVLEGIAQTIGGLKVKITEAKELIDALNKVGKPTVTETQNLHSAEAELKKWEDMLKVKGIPIPK